MTHRIERANICFYALLKLWARSLTAAPINKRMHIYKVCVKTALLYNIEATVLTEAGLQKLEAAHRRHIRCLLKIRWPERISNWRLYETSDATSLRKEIMVRRFDFLGKALRQERLLPARECMEQYFRHLDEAPKVRGRRPITIVSILDQALRLDDRRLQTWGTSKFYVPLL